MQAMVEESKTSGNTSYDNPEYKRLHTKISNMRQYFSPNYRKNRSQTKQWERVRLKEILRLEKMRSQLPSKRLGPGYRIYYVRYADDFLIGINGPYSLAVKVRQEVRDFLKELLKLDLNMDKTHITSSDKGVLFLGARLRKLASRTNEQKRRKHSITRSGRKVRARVPIGYIVAMAPLEKIVRKLASQGICRVKDFSRREVIPTRKTS